MTSYSDFTLNSPKRNWDLFRKLLFQSGVVREGWLSQSINVKQFVVKQGMSNQPGKKSRYTSTEKCFSKQAKATVREFCVALV